MRMLYRITMNQNFSIIFNLPVNLQSFHTLHTGITRLTFKHIYFLKRAKKAITEKHRFSSQK